MGKETPSSHHSEERLRLELKSGLDRSLQWLAVNRHEFAFTQDTNWHEQIFLMKPFAEFVLALRVLNRLGHDVADHVKWAWELTRNGDYLLDVLVARPDLASLAGLYASFHEFGYRNSRLRAWLTHLESMTSINAAESSLWSRIADKYNFQRLGLGEPPDQLMSQSWLESDPEPWTISDASAYSVTHEVFYITDFGCRADSLSVKATELLNLWLPVWVRCFADEQNWDIVGELLMVAICIKDSSWTGQLLLQMLKTQSEDGMFSGPAGAGRGLVNPTNSPARQRFLSNYHTTIVGSMALAMYLQLAQHD